MANYQNALPVDVSGSTVYSVGSAVTSGGSISTYPVGMATAGQTIIPVGTSAVQILSTNAARGEVTIQNKTGTSNPTVYLGVDNSVTSGVTGQNFASLDVGSNKSSTYGGEMWAIHGTSGYFAYIGVFEPTL